MSNYARDARAGQAPGPHPDWSVTRRPFARRGARAAARDPSVTRRLWVRFDRSSSLVGTPEEPQQADDFTKMLPECPRTSGLHPLCSVHCSVDVRGKRATSCLDPTPSALADRSCSGATPRAFEVPSEHLGPSCRPSRGGRWRSWRDSVRRYELGQQINDTTKLGGCNWSAHAVPT